MSTQTTGRSGVALPRHVTSSDDPTYVKHETATAFVFGALVIVARQDKVVSIHIIDGRVLRGII